MTMERYKNLYLWMIIPMVIMQLGIFMDYWGEFTDNAFSVHIHYWTGTIWYFYLVIQPYYAVKGQMDKHRTNCIVGMFLAGGVALTALSMMHRDIQSVNSSIADPENFGPFEPWFFYGVIAVEIPMVILFGYAIIQSIIKRKQLEDHAWWLISTVFIIMFPALGRGVQNVHILMNLEKWPDINIMTPTYFAVFLLVALTLLTAFKYGKLRHPATFLAVGINLFILLMEPIGRNLWFQDLMNTLIKG